MSLVSYFNKSNEKTELELTLDEVLKGIKTGAYQDKVLKLRNEKDPEKKRKIKAFQMPCFTTSGVFNTAISDSGKKTATKDDLIEHSGFIAMDFDNITDLDEAREILYADKYTYCGFVSVSGNGICLIVKIDPKKHLEAFKGLEKYYYQNYGYQIDQACSNVNRLRFVSFDPDLHIFSKSVKFTDYVKKKRGKPPKINNVVHAPSDIEFVLQQIEAKRIDLTQNYEDWISIGMALKAELGHEGLNAFQRVSQFHENYKPEQVEKKYNTFKSGYISIATFFHHAKNAGLQIVSKKTKDIAKSALYSKRGRVDVKGAVKKIEVLHNISEKESLPIIEQVYKEDIKLPKDGEENTIQEVEDFLRNEYDIVFNEVTNKYMLDGEDMKETHFNSVFVNTKKIIPKTTNEMIFSIIISEETPKVNPIKDWFNRHSSIKPKGLINKLADCIETPTGLKETNDFEFARHFIRKWMVGAVAMWHKEMSPLMLILAGEKQNTGKSHFFQYLLPDDLQKYFASAELSGDKDENLLMCSKIMILNDEMTNKSKADIAIMKKLCSTRWFNLRKPFGRSAEDFRRIATLCGTSNNLELLSDPTGNRRLIPIEVHSINHDSYNEIDKTELWMEAYHAYKSGEAFELKREDIERLNDSTNEFEEVSFEYEMILEFFEHSKENALYTEFLSNSELFTKIKIATQNNRLSQKKLGMELKRLGFQQQIKKIDGKTKRGYFVKNLK